LFVVFFLLFVNKPLRCKTKIEKLRNMNFLWAVCVLACVAACSGRNVPPAKISSANRQFELLQRTDRAHARAKHAEEKAKRLKENFTPLEPLMKHALEQNSKDFVPNAPTNPIGPVPKIISPTALQQPAQQSKVAVNTINNRDLEAIDGEVAKEGPQIDEIYLVGKSHLPIVSGRLFAQPLHKDEEISNLNTQFDPMKPIGMNIWGNSGNLKLGETRTRRYGQAYYGHLGNLQPGDRGTKEQYGGSPVAPYSQELVDLGEAFDTRPTVITKVTKSKYLSPNIRHFWLPGYLLQGLCADPKTGLPFPCQKMATPNAAPTEIQADRLSYDPFGVNDTPRWARKTFVSSPDAMR
jgi:hypothetical protein